MSGHKNDGRATGLDGNTTVNCSALNHDRRMLAPSTILRHSIIHRHHILLDLDNNRSTKHLRGVNMLKVTVRSTIEHLR